MSTVLSGYSDDLIYLHGDLNEEFTASIEADGNLVAFSNGVVVRVVYNNDGIWRITPVCNPDGSTLSIVQAPEDDDDNYTDRATIEAPVAWAIVRNTIVHTRAVRAAGGTAVTA